VNLLVTTVAPVFGVVLIGYLIVRLGLLGPDGSRRLVLFAFNGAIPVLLFQRLSTIDFPDQIEWGFLFAFYGGAFTAYACGIAIGRFGYGRPVSEQAIYGMGAGFSNTVMLGIPLLLRAFGPEAALPVFMIVAFHSATLLPITVGLIQAGRRQRDGVVEFRATALAREILANPIIVGIFLGLLANFVGLRLPGPLDSAAELVATIAIPCALVSLGASLAGYPLAGDLGPASVLAAVKLMLHPLIAWIIAVPILGLGAPWAQVAVVMAGMPSGALVYLFSARYQVATGLAARTVLVSSVASMVTISVLLVLMG
jgi:malonate transporter